MKTITIGRGPDNNITLNDAKTSRRHALLRCYPMGKMEIVDLSQNGTFINGIRIPSNKPCPLTRKDIVIFAHAETLDWNEVTNPYKYIKYTIMLCTTCIIVLCLGAGITAFLNSKRVNIEDAPEFVGPSAPTGSNKLGTDSIPKEKRKKEIIIPQKQKIKKENQTDSTQQKIQNNEQNKTKDHLAPNKEEEREREREMDVIG